LWWRLSATCFGFIWYTNTREPVERFYLPDAGICDHFLCGFSSRAIDMEGDGFFGSGELGIYVVNMKPD
jgi:hypothetical protein